jgi:hypothetical protein
MKIQGEMQIGEAARWAMRACAPLTGYPKNLIAMFAAIPVVVLVVVGIPTLSTELGAPGWLYLPLVLIIGWPVLMIFSRWSRNWQVARMKRALITRGTSNPLPVTFEITDEALALQQGALGWNAPWTTITDLNPVGPYWIFLAQGTPLYLPKRCFTSPSEEAAFVAACLARMSPSARDRSPKAVHAAATAA